METNTEVVVNAFADAQQMAEWYCDYVYGFINEAPELPSLTASRLTEHFGAGDKNEQLACITQALQRIHPDFQPSVALYICGYPKAAFEGLSDVSFDETLAQLSTQLLPKIASIVSTTPVQPRPARQTITTAPRERDIEGKDPMGMYMQELGRVSLLNAESEVELSKAIEAGLYAEHLLEEIDNGKRVRFATREELEWLSDEGKRSFDHFIEANLRLAVSVAKLHSYSKMDLVDITQEANLGLIRALEKFDYQKGYKFSTYATQWVRQAITRGMALRERTIRLPVHIYTELKTLRTTQNRMFNQTGFDPSVDDLAAELCTTPEHIEELLEWSKDSISYDTPVDDAGDSTMLDFISDQTAPVVEATVSRHQQIDVLQQLAARILNDRSADIILRRYGVGGEGAAEKLVDIGRRHGISAERVRQLEREAMQMLRSAVQNDDSLSGLRDLL